MADTKDPEWLDELIESSVHLGMAGAGTTGGRHEARLAAAVERVRAAARDHQQLRELAQRLIEVVDDIDPANTGATCVAEYRETIDALKAHLAKEPGR